MQNLGILFLTYRRTNYALRTIDGLISNLIGNDIQAIWYVADDGSDGDHVATVTSHLEKRIGEDGAMPHSIGDISQERRGYGGNMNWAQNRASIKCPAFLVMEDDWYLNRKLDIAPYFRLLAEKSGEVGYIRLGHLPVGLDLSSVGHNGHMYLNVHKNKQYAFSGNPHLKSSHAHSHYGPYPTGKNPGDTEIAYDSQIRTKTGPGILWPLLIGDAPYFDHLGEIKSYDPGTWR